MKANQQRRQDLEQCKAELALANEKGSQAQQVKSLNSTTSSYLIKFTDNPRYGENKYINLQNDIQISTIKVNRV